MSVDQLIHFNSNEEYERSVFQFVQMTGNMSIKEAKHAMDGQGRKRDEPTKLDGSIPTGRNWLPCPRTKAL